MEILMINMKMMSLIFKNNNRRQVIAILMLWVKIQIIRFNLQIQIFKTNINKIAMKDTIVINHQKEN